MERNKKTNVCQEALQVMPDKGLYTVCTKGRLLGFEHGCMTTCTGEEYRGRATEPGNSFDACKSEANKPRPNKHFPWCRKGYDQAFAEARESVDKIMRTWRDEKDQSSKESTKRANENFQHNTSKVNETVESPIINLTPNNNMQVKENGGSNENFNWESKDQKPPSPALKPVKNPQEGVNKENEEALTSAEGKTENLNLTPNDTMTVKANGMSEINDDFKWKSKDQEQKPSSPMLRSVKEHQERVNKEDEEALNKSLAEGKTEKLNLIPNDTMPVKANDISECNEDFKWESKDQEQKPLSPILKSIKEPQERGNEEDEEALKKSSAEGKTEKLNLTPDNTLVKANGTHKIYEDFKWESTRQEHRPPSLFS